MVGRRLAGRSSPAHGGWAALMVGKRRQRIFIQAAMALALAALAVGFWLFFFFLSLHLIAVGCAMLAVLFFIRQLCKSRKDGIAP